MSSEQVSQSHEPEGEWINLKKKEMTEVISTLGKTDDVNAVVEEEIQMGIA
jgi:hypothetical protein